MKPIEIFSHWNQVRSDLTSTIHSFKDSELTFVPFEGSWSAGRIMLHIAGAEDGWLRYVIAKDLDEWPDHYKLSNFPNKESILSVLTEIHKRTINYLDSLELSALLEKIKAPWGKEISQQWIFWHIIEHEIHHRGELSLILGMLGREGLDV